MTGLTLSEALERQEYEASKGNEYTIHRHSGSSWNFYYLLPARFLSSPRNPFFKRKSYESRTLN